MKRIDYAEAERVLGGRLDRRQAFYFDDSVDALEMFGGGPVYTYFEWTRSCSGCHETEDGYSVGRYDWDAKAKCHIGSGCDECGYTGKRRDGWYSPACIRAKKEAP